MVSAGLHAGLEWSVANCLNRASALWAHRWLSVDGVAIVCTWSHARTGEAGFRPAHCCNFWEYLDRHPSVAAMVDASMARMAAARAAVFARAYDFAGITHVVDVGAGHGDLLVQVLQAHPHLHGVAFDRPSVIEAARTRLAEAGLVDRCEVVAGDFFAGVPAGMPAGGDAYVLSWILHDWDDEAAARILANCRAAMADAGDAGDAGRLLVLELVLPSSAEPHAPTTAEALARTVDLEMLGGGGGRERTAAEYRALFARAGFRPTRVLPLEALPWSVIEAAPA